MPRRLWKETSESWWTPTIAAASVPDRAASQHGKGSPAVTSCWWCYSHIKCSTTHQQFASVDGNRSVSQCRRDCWRSVLAMIGKEEKGRTKRAGNNTNNQRAELDIREPVFFFTWGLCGRRPIQFYIYNNIWLGYFKVGSFFLLMDDGWVHRHLPATSKLKFDSLLPQQQHNWYVAKDGHQSQNCISCWAENVLA